MSVNETSKGGATKSPRILIAASGSGGHLFPALHIARAIKSAAPDARIEFVGSGRPLEEKLIVQNGFVRHIVKISGVKQRGFRGLIDFLAAVPRAFSQLRDICAELSPTVVVGVGGYVSVLPVVLAKIRGIPTWIHEAELKPGLANAFLGLFSDRISVAFQEAKILRRRAVVYTGHPIRGGLGEVRREAPRDRLTRLLILGGSQGAQGIDNAVGALAPFLRDRAIEVWHQCRPENVAPVVAAYRSHGVAARVDSFIDDMSGALQWCDVIISRSGASAVMELSVVNIPTIFVPYPFAQGNHQLANAQVLAAAGKALVVEEGEGFPTRLEAALRHLLAPENYRRMLDTPYQARSLEAADRIASGILAISKPPPPGL
jgi:UDP-N-acetylglucosamine--N-acetylmuramyl-(pentapeptide) pyrophosphoryl-undecaprenol N-acetylglucosamine transferase